MENQVTMKKTIIFPAILISLFIVLGITFDTVGSTKVLHTLSPACFGLWGLGAIIAFITAYLVNKTYNMFDSAQSWKWLNKLNSSINAQKIICFYEQHPYLFVYLLFFIAYLPYIIASYPAIFWGDTAAQIEQGYNLPGATPNFLKLLNENVFLNQHYPVVHTLLLHVCLVTGNALFGSFNIGVFIYAIIQFIFMATIVAYIVNYFYSNNVPITVLLAFIAYYIFHPRINNHMFMVTKEIIYGGFTMLFVTSTFGLMKAEPKDNIIKQTIILFIGGIGVCLFRNEGIIVVGATLVIAIVASIDRRKSFAAVLLGIMLVTQLLTRVVYPAFDITPGSRREMLSVPFQQTALYLNRHADEVTDEERKAISGVANYDTLSKCYEWNTADPAKSLFDDYCSNEQLKEYLKVWFLMFFKHPDTYFDATLHQIYGYYYPPAGFLYRVPYNDSEKLMTDANIRCKVVGTDFHHPKFLQKYRTLYEKGFELLARIPPFILLTLSATYLWCLIILVFYYIRTRRKHSLIASIPLILQFLAMFAGPLGGNSFRYIYSIVVSIFPLAIIGLHIERMASE